MRVVVVVFVVGVTDSLIQLLELQTWPLDLMPLKCVKVLLREALV